MAAAADGRNVEEAEECFTLAEECFLNNDVPGAILAAREAQFLFPALPGLGGALAAYEIHAAAAASRGRMDWYRVLGFPFPSTTGRAATLPTSQGAIRQRYRRLCLLLHPDKNRSAAAEGAFKLLQQAWGALSARHPPVPVASPASRRRPRSPSRGRGQDKFPCSVSCPRCGARHAPTRMLCVGTWHLPCTACGECSLFNVRGPDDVSIW